MSILIKDMKIPLTCAKCVLRQVIECEKWKLVRCIELDKHKDCPLVNVLPHGDLIDRDALISNHTIDQYDWSEVIDVEDIRNAFTIIPAEES